MTKDLISVSFASFKSSFSSELLTQSDQNELARCNNAYRSFVRDQSGKEYWRREIRYKNGSSFPLESLGLALTDWVCPIVRHKEARILSSRNCIRQKKQQSQCLQTCSCRQVLDCLANFVIDGAVLQQTGVIQELKKLSSLGRCVVFRCVSWAW